MATIVPLIAPVTRIVHCQVGILVFCFNETTAISRQWLDEGIFFFVVFLKNLMHVLEIEILYMRT